MRGTGASLHGEGGVGLYAYLVPQVLRQEGVECLASSLDNERLDVMVIQTLQVQRMLVVDDESLRRRPRPVAHGEQWMLALVSHSAHEDGILFGTQLMVEHLGERRRDADGMAAVVDEAVGRLCPF